MGDRTNPRPRRMGLTHEEYLLGYIDQSGGPDACWPWTGTIANTGYGADNWCREKIPSAHRSVYELLVGPIPEGYQIDHTCHDPAECRPTVAAECPHRACVNPAHLEPVTQLTNIMRGGSLFADKARQTHCIRGHSLGPDGDVHIDPKRNNRRTCRECRRQYDRTRRPPGSVRKR